MQEVSKWKRSRTPILIMLVTILPLIFAAILYFRPGWFPLHPNNHGTLVQPPRKLKIYPLNEPITGKQLSETYFSGKWTIVYISPPDCSASCKATLYATRQVRLATGDAMRRVQRLDIVMGKPKHPSYLQNSDPDMTVVDASTPQGRAFVREFTHGTGSTVGSTIYLVDPRGFLMMYYPARGSAQGLLKDLLHLLQGNNL